MYVRGKIAFNEFKNIPDQEKKEVEYLLDRGATARGLLGGVRDGNGFLPLHWAAEQGRTAEIRLLLRWFHHGRTLQI